MTKVTSISAGLLTVLVGSLVTANAAAHNFAAHDAITRAAVSAMHYWVEDNSTLQFCPSSTDFSQVGGDFEIYKRQVKTALTNLRQLKTGLQSITANVHRCSYNTTAADNTVTASYYYPEDNLDQIGQFRISDFRYIVERDYQTACQMDALHDQRLTTEGWRTLGSVLGVMAGDVDRRTDDTVMWVKPLNAFVWGAIKDGLSEGATILGAIALLPFACLASLFSSGSCGDAKNWAIASNPIDWTAGMIPGIPYNFTGSDLGFDINGIWHFEQSASAGNALTFANSPSGIYYPFAGPSQVPGVLDTAILGVTSIAGVSLNAHKSLGVRDFGQFDEASRAWPLWEAHSMCMTEYTPVSKLAKYGAKEYAAGNYTTAEKLGYPLHAFADATFPQHIANTTSWGHRPMEDAINDVRIDALSYDTTHDRFTTCHRAVEMVLKGYEDWKAYNLARGGHVDVEDMVEALTSYTRGWIDSHMNIWSDSASDQYFLTSSPHADSVGSYANDYYDGVSMTLAQFSAPLELAATGASIAYLVDVGLEAVASPMVAETKCPTGTEYVHGVSCAAVPPADPTISCVDTPTTTGRTAATPAPAGCIATGQPCSVSADCCSFDCESGLCQTAIQ